MRVNHVGTALMAASSSHQFLGVSRELAGFVDHTALLGEDVHKAFPSARDDIREMGNCLAADCNTAAVFHMMRAVEWALRALAAHLGVRRLPRRRKNGKIKYTPISFGDWELILNQLHGRVDKRLERLRPGPVKKERQQFYYSALQEFQGFRDAFRNHTMHAREHYSATDAAGLLVHVKRFMTALAPRIPEKVIP